MKKIVCLFACLFVGTANATVIDFEELSYGQNVAYDNYQSEGLLLDSSINWGTYDNAGYPLALINNTDFAGNLIGSFTNLVSDLTVLMGDTGGDVDTGTLEVYDINGNLLASDSGSNSSWFTVSVSTNNIASFQVFQTGLVVYDEISFNMASAPVPEPASIALLGLGLAGIGFSRKKKTS